MHQTNQEEVANGRGPARAEEDCGTGQGTSGVVKRFLGGGGERGAEFIHIVVLAGRGRRVGGGSRGVDVYFLWGPGATRYIPGIYLFGAGTAGTMEARWRGVG